MIGWVIDPAQSQGVLELETRGYKPVRIRWLINVMRAKWKHHFRTALRGVPVHAKYFSRFTVEHDFSFLILLSCRSLEFRTSLGTSRQNGEYSILECSLSLYTWGQI